MPWAYNWDTVPDSGIIRSSAGFELLAARTSVLYAAHRDPQQDGLDEPEAGRRGVLHAAHLHAGLVEPRGSGARGQRPRRGAETAGDGQRRLAAASTLLLMDMTVPFVYDGCARHSCAGQWMSAARIRTGTAFP